MNSLCVFYPFRKRKIIEIIKRKPVKSRLAWKKIGESLVTSGRSGWGKNIADLCFHNLLIKILCFHNFLIQNFVENTIFQ